MPSFICRKAGCKKIITSTGFCSDHTDTYGKEYDRHRGSSNERGYDSKWRRARLVYLAANPLCVQCRCDGVVHPASVIDHIVPHRGDRELFNDQSNWQSLCKRHHDEKTRRGE